MRSFTADVSGESFIHQVIHIRRLSSANSELISLNQSKMASARLFWVDPAPIISAVNARSDYALKKAAKNSITT